MDHAHCKNEVLSNMGSKHYIIIMSSDLLEGFRFYMGKNVQN